MCLCHKQYNLVPVKGWWCPAAGKVTVGLASHWQCHRLQWFIHLRAHGLSQGDEHHSLVESVGGVPIYLLPRKWWRWCWCPCLLLFSREATKCYCGASNCRGVIGSGKRSPLKSTRRKLAARNKDKKKLDVFSDLFVSYYAALQVSVPKWLARPTVVWEDQGSNYTAGSCVYCGSCWTSRYHRCGLFVISLWWPRSWNCLCCILC